MTQQKPQLLRASDGEPEPLLGGVKNRYMLDGKDTQGKLTVLQHLFEPRALAGPMHRHEREDEYTYVLNGRIGAILGGEELEAGPGDLILKPRGQWHTFWNASDEPAVVLELIAASGLEDLFREIGRLTSPPDPQAMAAMAGRYGCELDFDATFAVLERHRLKF